MSSAEDDLPCDLCLDFDCDCRNEIDLEMALPTEENDEPPTIFCCFACGRGVDRDSFDFSLECCTSCTMMVMMRQNMERRARRARRAIARDIPLETEDRFRDEPIVGLPVTTIPMDHVWCVQCRHFVLRNSYDDDLQCCAYCIMPALTQRVIEERQRNNERVVAELRNTHINRQ